MTTGTSAFGVDHGGVSKAAGSTAEERRHHTGAVVAGTGAGVGVGGTAVLAGTKLPEHSHYSHKTRKHIHSLPAGEHDLPIKMLTDKKPRKLGQRKQQRSYVAAMARERPADTYGPVPITRYKKGAVIQRDGGHTVMAHSMMGKKTVRVKIEDAPGHRPTRRTADELVRRGQVRYQQRRLKQYSNLSEKKMNHLIGEYTPNSRKANTAKRPHGVVEEGFKYSKKPYGPKQVLARPSWKATKKTVKTLRELRKRDERRGRDVAAGVTGAAGVGVLGTTPVRRSAHKVNVSGGSMKASDAEKVVNPGYRPGNRRAIQVMARNLGHLENEPTTVIRYKSGHVIPFDGNHRATARIVRGDKKIPVKVIQGGERPAVSVTRNAYHVAQQKAHRSRIKSDKFKPETSSDSPHYTGKHAGEPKVYNAIANASPSRSGRRVALESSRFAAGPSKLMLRTKQGATIAGGTALLGGAAHLHHRKPDHD